MRPRFKRLGAGAVALFAAAAFSVPASAEVVVVFEEGQGVTCPATSTFGTDVDGGCLIHARSEGFLEFRKHVFGIESHVALCTSEFHARVGSNLSGMITEPRFGPACTRQACTGFGGEAIPWPVSGAEGTTWEGTEYMTTNLCIEPVGGGTDETCEIDLPFQSYENSHRQEFGHFEVPSHGISGFRCEIEGHWNTESGGTHDGQFEQEIVIAHIT